MVDKSYLLEKPPAPSAAKVAFDQTVFPVLIDAAGRVEGVVERVLGTVRRAPSASVLVAAGLGFLLARVGRRG